MLLELPATLGGPFSRALLNLLCLPYPAFWWQVEGLGDVTVAQRSPFCGAGALRSVSFAAE